MYCLRSKVRRCAVSQKSWCGVCAQLLEVLVIVLAVFSVSNRAFANTCTSNGTGGGSWNSAASWTSCGSTTPQPADTVTVVSGDTITLNTNATTTSVTINNGGVLTEDGGGRVLAMSGVWTTSGTFTPNQSTVKITSSLTLTGNTFFNNLVIDTNTASSRTVTLTGYTATTTGVFRMDNSSTGGINLTGGTVAALGDVVWDGSNAGSNTSILSMAGTGDQVLTFNNGTLTTGEFTPFVVNKPSGNLTFVNGKIIHTLKDWTFITMGTGQLITTGSTVVFANGGSQTITGSHALNNVVFDYNNAVARTYTIEANTSLTVSGTLTIDNSGSGNMAINTGTLIATGDINADIAHITTSSANLIISGSNSQLMTLSGGSTTVGDFASTTINKTGGTLTVAGTLRTAKNFTHTAGVADWTTNGTTFALAGGNWFPGSVTYNNVYIGGTVTLTGNLTLQGDWTNASSFTTGTNGVTFTGTATSTLVSGGTGTGQDFQNLTINKTGGIVQVSTNNLDIDGTLTISGGILDLNGFSLSTTATCNNSGTLRLAGFEIISCVPTHASGSVVEYVATSSISRIVKDWTYKILKFSGSASGVFTDSGTRTVEENFIIMSGTYSAPTTLNIAGNFTNSGGTFAANSGSVILNGTDQTITGNTTFNNLTKSVVVPAILTFDHLSTQTIVGALTLQGAASNLLSLRSDSPGVQWSIDPQGSRAITYVDVMDSHNTNGSAITVGTTVADSHNNTGWTFQGNETQAVVVLLANYGGGGSGYIPGYGPLGKLAPIVQTSPIYTFVKNLERGSVGPEVLALQKFLNAQKFLVSVAGAGSPGNETSVFGSATQAALIRYQKTNGIKPAIGYFGPVTRAYIADHR